METAPEPESTAESWSADARSVLAIEGWRASAVSGALDVTLLAALTLSLLDVQLVISFHLAFASMTMLSFVQPPRQFLCRAVPGTVLVTAAVAIAVQAGTASVEELYEIPIMVLMLAMVFWASLQVRQLIAERAFQQSRVERLHVASQIELKDQLFMSQRLATQGRLAAGIVHNFRNSMTAILSLAERIEYEAQQQAVANASQRIQIQARGAAELLKGLLSLTTRDPGRDGADLRKVLDDDRGVLELLAGPQTQLEYAVQDVPIHVPLDSVQLSHVLLNLVMNALDAIEGEGRIEVSAQLVDGQVRLCVSDDGQGMDEASMARAFEPFFTTKSAGGGSGLGLFMVQAIIEDAGGSVWIDSELGQGTSIEVELPAVAPDTEAPRIASLETRPEQFFGTERILVVEDDPVVREQLVSVLEMFGYSVVDAADGEEAVGLATGNDGFDLVVSDVVMPRCGGPELQRRVVAVGLTVPFLFVSSHERASDDHELPDGANLLPKPFGRTALLSRVRGVLD
jgi:signal transduction histidine kinase